MDKSIIPHVFSSLMSLERQLDRQNAGAEKRDAQFISEARKVINHMRRVANQLQLTVASNDERSTVRALRIYYGLLHMVRPELVSSPDSHDAPRSIGRKRPTLASQLTVH